jgi:site-specific recombinase
MFDVLVRIANNPESSDELLIELFREIRPKSKDKNSEIINKVEQLIHTLENDDYLRSGLENFLAKVFYKRKLSSAITETGIIKNQNFFTELTNRIGHKLLPIQPSKDTLSYLLSNIFYKSDDYKWVNAISYEHWEKLFILLNFKPLAEKSNEDFAVQEVLIAIEILTLRISGMGVDESLLKMVPSYNKLDSPFVSLTREVNILCENIRRKNDADRSSDSIDIKQIFIIINQCYDYIDKVVENREVYGISFNTTIKVARLKQELDRLSLALNFLSIDKEERRFGETIDFIQKIIEVNSIKNDIGSFINYSTGMVAYQITQHTGKTGEHYITNSKSEYFKMFYSALGGGMIVGFLCLFKVLLSYTDASPLGTALLYSINYSLGFIAIYLMGFTLATKQPAMTAVTLAQTIKSKSKVPDYTDFSNLFTRLFRSQFIAFVGNVFMAFPVALALGFIWIEFFGYNAVKPYKAENLLFEINPFLSLALLHASIAGFYLFLSGLISGYYMNNNIHNQISFRFRNHPILRGLFSEARLNAIANFYDKNIGGIMGNLWFGVFLGSTGIIGYFIGLPIDIRHIAFAAGNFALAIIGLDFQISTYDIIISILCIGLIGFFNFIVSFLLSLVLAMRSRRIPISNIRFMIGAIMKNFRKSPFSFFFPLGVFNHQIKEPFN